MRQKLSAVLIVIIVFALCCELLSQDLEQKAKSIPLDFSDVKDKQISKILEDNYQKKGREFEYKLKLIRDKAGYDIFELSFPSIVSSSPPQANDTVYLEYWKPETDDKVPAVILLHPLGGLFEIMRGIAQKLVQRDIAVLLLWMPYYGKRAGEDSQKMLSTDMDETIANFKQAVLDVSRAYDWLCQREEINNKQIGIVGISLGAIVGALTAGVDNRFSRSVFIIGGADLARIVTHRSKITEEFADEMERLGLTEEELREKLVEIEPLTFAFRMKKENILMINASNDEVIPRECAERLWEKAGKPKIKWYKATHTTMLFLLNSILKDIVSFIKEGK